MAKQVLKSTTLVAHELGCDTRTIRRHAAALDIGAVLAGTAMVFTPREVEQLRAVVQKRSGRPAGAKNKEKS